ncbi:phosphonopyruvate decarboxylase [Amycolatopsis xylanica]|uniref:Phosphonopyruvate decarboxylase n=1 Tax=Amycolatopsis xylanica TaxID=589385 RepID=A0A1H2U2K7_9PSEU|nr:thiamine pyrophosphate-binding protein [Amycolatopsis xylanica]SDW49819.1 phosphonopyruvate decarboxylase [Amycolatopsis xylanica]
MSEEEPLPTPSYATTVLGPERVVADAFAARDLGPYLATPCGVLAPLLRELGQSVITVPREETAVGLAAGAALGGRRPVVLMQNSGFGASVNGIASLIRPYEIPILLVISLRGVAPDHTSENLVMGKATEPILDLLGVPHRTLRQDRLAEHLGWAADTLATRRGAVALLVPPDLFGWSPA